MVTIKIEKSKSRKQYNRFSKFVLIGHNIDGFVNFSFKEFQNYEAVLQEVPAILNNLSFGGEWDVQLYQVPSNYSLDKQYGYYQVPNKGSLIFELQYDQVGTNYHVYMDNSLIQVKNVSYLYEENWNAEPHEEFSHYETYESYKSVFLTEKSEIAFKNHKYNGDLDLFLEKTA